MRCRPHSQDNIFSGGYGYDERSSIFGFEYDALRDCNASYFFS